MQFAFEGEGSSILSQKALEEYIIKLEDPVEVRKLVLSMINSAYQLNHIIPNVELVFYKIFCSPISTKAIRKEQESTDLLAGNIFAQEGLNLGPSVYRSLLETVALHPKKKHFKKIVQHMMQFENKENIDS